MLLGLSGAQGDADLDMGIVSGDDRVDGGIASGALLVEFAGKVHNGSVSDDDRAALIEAIGPEGLVDAAAICANFNMMVRIADGTGTPLDAGSVPMSEQLRSELDLNRMTSMRLAESG